MERGIGTMTLPLVTSLTLSLSPNVSPLPFLLSSLLPSLLPTLLPSLPPSYRTPAPAPAATCGIPVGDSYASTLWNPQCNELIKPLPATLTVDTHSHPSPLTPQSLGPSGNYHHLPPSRCTPAPAPEATCRMPVGFRSASSVHWINKAAASHAHCRRTLSVRVSHPSLSPSLPTGNHHHLPPPHRTPAPAPAWAY